MSYLHQSQLSLSPLWTALQPYPPRTNVSAHLVYHIDTFNSARHLPNEAPLNRFHCLSNFCQRDKFCDESTISADFPFRTKSILRDPDPGHWCVVLIEMRHSFLSARICGVIHWCRGRRAGAEKRDQRGFTTVIYYLLCEGLRGIYLMIELFVGEQYW